MELAEQSRERRDREILLGLRLLAHRPTAREEKALRKVLGSRKLFAQLIEELQKRGYAPGPGETWMDVIKKYLPIVIKICLMIAFAFLGKNPEASKKSARKHR